MLDATPTGAPDEDAAADAEARATLAAQVPRAAMLRAAMLSEVLDRLAGGAR